MGTQEKAEGKIQRVLNRLETEQVDNLAPDSGEFKVIAEAIMAWYQLLIANGIVQKDGRGIEVLSASILVLATLVKYTYALGRRQGRRDCSPKFGGRGMPVVSELEIEIDLSA